MRRLDPPVVAASLSGAADAAWAARLAPHVGGAILGGIALDEPTRVAAERLVDRGRAEFLPADPVEHVRDQLAACADLPLRLGWNFRAADPGPVREAAAVCAAHDAVLEVNAHCRQSEMCAAGAGERLLREPARLREQVWAAAAAGATVAVKVRAEVPGVDLPAVARVADAAGADLIHVDAMDTEAVVADVAAATDAAVIANNGVRDRATVREYAEYGADAVSLARPTEGPDRAVLTRVAAAARDLVGTGAGRRVDAGAP